MRHYDYLPLAGDLVPHLDGGTMYVYNTRRDTKGAVSFVHIQRRPFTDPLAGRAWMKIEDFHKVAVARPTPEQEEL